MSSRIISNLSNAIIVYAQSVQTTQQTGIAKNIRKTWLRRRCCFYNIFKIENNVKQKANIK